MGARDARCVDDEARTLADGTRAVRCNDLFFRKSPRRRVGLDQTQPSEVLLASLAKPWRKEHEAIAGKTLPGQDVVDWLEEHLPEGGSLTDPPRPQDGLEQADPGLAQQ